jgi:hypothetical protein
MRMRYAILVLGGLVVAAAALSLHYYVTARVQAKRSITSFCAALTQIDSVQLTIEGYSPPTTLRYCDITLGNGGQSLKDAIVVKKGPWLDKGETYSTDKRITMVCFIGAQEVGKAELIGGILLRVVSEHSHAVLLVDNRLELVLLEMCPEEG